MKIRNHMMADPKSSSTKQNSNEKQRPEKKPTSRPTSTKQNSSRRPEENETSIREDGEQRSDAWPREPSEKQRKQRSQPDGQNELLESALEYLEQGWSIIPILRSTKRPAVKWAKYQERQPTEEEVTGWFERFDNLDIALVTGAVSGLVVVDIDNAEALEYARSIDLHSPIQASTKKGIHLYFEHPQTERFGPRVGSSNHVDWPQVPGLDFRGDGGYALIPPSTGYTWNVPHELTHDDAPIWKGIKSPVVDIFSGEAISFDQLDLSEVSAFTPSQWTRMTQRVAKHGLLKDGDGRNQALVHYLSEEIINGVRGEELKALAQNFMETFFSEPLPDREVAATINSIDRMERTNHPERYHQKEPEPEKPDTGIPLISEVDADALLAASEATNYLIEPWLWKGSITQIYGYSGSGKSLLAQHLLYAMASGQNRMGPYEMQPARVLYLDWENGRGVLGNRLKQLQESFGSSNENFMVWASFLEDESISLFDEKGRDRITSIINQAKPDVVVIDTIRSAFPGLEENSAEAWSKVNEIMMRMRNAGIGVIALHHSNKPGDGGLGKEAGSTNQLTVLDHQIRISQVYESEELAKQNSGLYNGELEMKPWDNLEHVLPAGFHLNLVVELRYRKIREFTEMHTWVNYIGIASNRKGERIVVGNKNPRDKAKRYADVGKSEIEIADLLHKPVSAVQGWLNGR